MKKLIYFLAILAWNAVGVFAQAPANDLCSNAIPVGCGAVVTGTTSTATPDPGTPNCAAGTTSNGVWYTFLGTGQNITASLCGSGYDSQIHIYTGTCGALTCVIGNDDFCGLQSQVTFATTLGTTYYIYINGWSSNSGPYTLTLSGSPPANDVCSAATPISPGTINGSSACAASDVAPACIVGDAAGPGVWYTFTSACAGSDITLSLCGGATFNTLMRVYSGSCGSLVCVAGDDDFCSNQSEVTFTSAVETYYVLVYGNTASDFGDFTLTFTQDESVAPVPDVIPLPLVSGSCQVDVTPPTATDNCVGTVMGTTTDPMSYTAPGNYTVTWTYDDGNGNTSTQTQSVTVNPDVIPPTVVCSNDTVVGADPDGCTAIVAYLPPQCGFSGQYYATVENNLLDNGYFTTSAWPQYIADDFVVPAGDLWQVSNIVANMWELPGALTSIVINIHSDAGGVPGPIINTQTLSSANWTSVFLGNAFGYTVSEYDFVLPNPIVVSGGASPTTYWLSIYDNAAPGNGVAWSYTGVIANYPAVFSGSATGPWNTVGPVGDMVFALEGSVPATMTDNCGCPSLTQIAGLPSGSAFPIGTTVNTFVVTDAAGLTDTCSFSVTVNDVTPPLTALGTLTLTISYGQFFLDESTWQVLDGNGNVIATGGPYGFGGPMVVAQVVDLSGAVEPLTFIGETQGTFNDNVMLFEFTCGSNIMASGTIAGGTTVTQTGIQGCQITLPDLYDPCSVTVSVPPDLQDVCAGSIPGTTNDPVTYDATGTYTITWMFDDGSGNVATLTQTVIIDDQDPPVPDVASLPNFSDPCEVVISTIPTATDSCTGSVNGTTNDPLTYDFPGNYVVTWTYIDASGNTTTQTQTVSITDNSPPVPNQPLLPNIIGNCVVTIEDAPTATDNCAGTIIATTMDPLTYYFTGTFFITWHYTDGNGNFWTQHQTVVVEGCAGLDDPEALGAVVYPNPSEGLVTLQLSDKPASNTKIDLVNVLGQTLYTAMLTDQITLFDFSQFDSGTYFLLIQNESKRVHLPIVIK